MAQFKVAVVVGSNRRDSINRKLAQALGKLAPADVAFQVAQIDDLPIYNQDHEGSLPAGVVRFKNAIEAADGVLFVTPEHSRSIPAVLKNAIDWGARPWGKNSWTGKVVAVTGTNGILPPPKGYLKGLKALLEKHGILLVTDEVMCGWGRTGKLFAFQHGDIVPDICTMAKGLTSSYLPLGVMAVSDRIANHFRENVFWGGLTYNAHPLCLASALAGGSLRRAVEQVLAP